MEIGCPSCSAALIIPATNGAVALFAKPEEQESAAAAALMTKQKDLDGALTELKTLREQLALAVSDRERVKVETVKREELAAQAEAAKFLQDAQALEERIAAGEAARESDRAALAETQAKLAEAVNAQGELSAAQAKLATAREELAKAAAVQAELSAAQAKLKEAELLAAELAEVKAELAESGKAVAELAEVRAKLSALEKKEAELAATQSSKLSETQKDRQR